MPIRDKRIFSKIRSKVRALVKRGEHPSMAVAVAQRGEILWEEAFGWMDKDDRVKAAPTTIYPIASLSKSLTATGLMILVEQKKVGLDDPVEEYIAPSKLTVYEGKASKVTVRKILNMTSGVPHGYIVYEDPHATLDLRKFIGQYGIVVFPPGEVELYSNFSYAVLELIIENVTHASFANFMQTEVFDPLGMIQTSVGVPNSLEHVATKYKSNSTVVPHNYFVPAAAGGVYSSAHDLIRYGMFHLKNHLPNQRQILGDETLNTMHRAKDGNFKSAIMALGWASVTLDNNTAWILSNGGIEGATSMLSLVPAGNLAVVCLTNSSSPTRITDQIAIEITDALLPRFSDRVEAFMRQHELETAMRLYRPTRELIGSWEGKIKAQATETPIKMIFHDNGKIDVSLGEHHETVLKNASLGNGELKGDFKGTFCSRIMVKYSHSQTISIHVKINNNRMYGVATESEGGKGLLSPSYVCLQRI
jgi:CubicO group peptidase (beta-lactamase class C family)